MERSSRLHISDVISEKNAHPFHSDRTNVIGCFSSVQSWLWLFLITLVAMYSVGMVFFSPLSSPSLFPPLRSLLLPTFAQAATLQMVCPSVNEAPSALTRIVGNDEAHFGNECLYTNPMTITMGATLGTASVVISGGKVSAGTSNCILFQGFNVTNPADADLGNSKGPLFIMVQQVTFFDGAILRFERLFPNKTDIIVEGNTFYNMQGLTNIGGILINSKLSVVCIVVDFSAAANYSLTYSTGFSLMIANNAASVATPLNVPVCVVCLVSQTALIHFTLTGTSAVSIVGNTLANSTLKEDAHVAYVYLYAASAAPVSSLTLSGSASMLINKNAAVNVSGPGADVVVAYIHVQSALSPTSSSGPCASTLVIQGAASITLNENSARNSSVGSITCVFVHIVAGGPSSASLTVDGSSSNAAIITSKNSIIQSIAQNAYVVWVAAHSNMASSSSSADAFITLVGNASMVAEMNTMVNCSITARAYVAWATVEGASTLLIVGDSALASLSRNVFAGSTAQNAFVTCLYVSATSDASSITVEGGSASIVFSKNTMVNSSSKSTSQVAHVYVKSAASDDPPKSASLIIRGNASVIANENAIANTVTAWASLVYVYVYSKYSVSSLTLEGGAAALRCENNIIIILTSSSLQAIKSDALVIFRLALTDALISPQTHVVRVANQSRVSITDNSITSGGDGENDDDLVSSSSCSSSSASSDLIYPSSAAAAKNLTIFDASGCLQFVVLAESGALMNISNNCIDAVAAIDVRMIWMELSASAASPPSRIVGKSSSSSSSSASLTTGHMSSGLVVDGNTISHAVIYCGGGPKVKVNSSSLGILWLMGGGGELHLEGGSGVEPQLSVSNNVIREVIFAPNPFSSFYSPYCAIAFSAILVSANLGIVDGASMSLTRNQIAAVWLADTDYNGTMTTTATNSSSSSSPRQQQLLLTDASMSGGCLLTLRGNVSLSGTRVMVVDGEKTMGSQLRVVSNNITDINASRSVIALASNVAISQMGSGVIIRDNVVIDVMPSAASPTDAQNASSLSSSSSLAAFVSIQSILFERSSSDANQQLSITGNTAEMTTANDNNRTQQQLQQQDPAFVFIQNSQCEIVPSYGINSECAMHFDNNVIQSGRKGGGSQTPPLIDSFAAFVFGLPSILNFTNVTFKNNTIHASNATTTIIAIDQRASIDLLVVEGNKVTYTAPLLLSPPTAAGIEGWRGGGGGGEMVRSLLQISGEMHWALGWRGLKIINNIIMVTPIDQTSSEASTPSTFFPNSSQWVLFDNSVKSLWADNTLESIEVILCPNVLFGSKQARTAAKIASLLRNPDGFNGIASPNISLKYKCFTHSPTVSCSTSHTPSSAATISSTALTTFSVASTLSQTLSISAHDTLSAAAQATPSASPPATAATLTSTASLALTSTFQHTATHHQPVVKVTESRTIRILVPIPFIPSPTLTQLTTAVGVTVVTIGGIALPVAGMMQGVSTALLRMTACGGDALSEDEALPAMIHPLQFGIGDGDAKYARAVVVGNLIIIPLICALVFYFAIPSIVSAASSSHDGGTTTFASQLASSRPRTGWPANMVVPFSLLAEGSAMASVALLSYREASALDIFLGLLGVVVLLAIVVMWGLKLRFPFLVHFHLNILKRKDLSSPMPVDERGSRLQCVRAEPQQTLVAWLLIPRWEWTLSKTQEQHENDNNNDGGATGLLFVEVIRSASGDGQEVEEEREHSSLGGAAEVTSPPESQSSRHQQHLDPNEAEDEEDEERFLGRWSFLVGDSWWLWSSFLAFVFSLLVGVAEGMPSDTETLCRLRWSLAFIGAVGQAFVVLTNTIPSELFLIGLLSVVSCVLVALVALSTFDVFEEDEKEALNEALEVVGTISAVLGLVTMGVGIVCSLVELYKRWVSRRKASAARKRGGRDGRGEALLSSSSGSLVELDAFSQAEEILPPIPPLSAPNINRAGESSGEAFTRDEEEEEVLTPLSAHSGDHARHGQDANTTATAQRRATTTATSGNRNNSAMPSIPEMKSPHDKFPHSNNNNKHSSSVAFTLEEMSRSEAYARFLDELDADIERQKQQKKKSQAAFKS